MMHDAVKHSRDLVIFFTRDYEQSFLQARIAGELCKRRQRQ
jgi:hypothetical protein